MKSRWEEVKNMTRKLFRRQSTKPEISPVLHASTAQLAELAKAQRRYVDAKRKLYADAEGIIRCEKCGTAIMSKIKGHKTKSGGYLPAILHCPKCDPMPGDK